MSLSSILLASEGYGQLHEPDFWIVLTDASHDASIVDANWLSGDPSVMCVIKERNSCISCGFAFIDFPSVGEACKMMDGIGDDGLVVDDRKLFFEYRGLKLPNLFSPWHPCACLLAAFAILKIDQSQRGFASPKTSFQNMVFEFSQHRLLPNGSPSISHLLPWRYPFHRPSSSDPVRVFDLQCNEQRTDDAPAADVVSSNPTQLGRKGSDAGRTHVLVVLGLDDNADEEMLRYELSKQAPIKELCLVRDKFTHVSRGFAFVHFHLVEDSTKALEATNGTTLEKNGQINVLKYAKNINEPGLGAAGASQSSSLAAAAIEAATFAQQVFIIIVTMEPGILMICKLSCMSPMVIRMARHREKQKMSRRHLIVLVTEM
ncbi:hypothetical protein NE237_026775 [Protea cynaroides]|uniref:RRM domain-containing protein n=1 Tax=Protea cynaroides TaxID=273540 RepID=A0A9Q0GNW3_9MAGN|nr:hypothetical protein NE237_026775 [Protea cynaroides]